MLAAIPALLVLLHAPAQEKKAAPAEGTSYATFAELRAAVDEDFRRLTREMNDRHLAAIERYLASKASAPDRDQALGAAAEVAYHLERWEAVRGHAERYAADFPAGPRRGEMAMFVAHALANLPGKRAEAKAAFEKVAAAASGDPNRAFGAWSALADFQVEWGDLEGARATYDRLGEAMKDQQGIEDFLEAAKGNLDLVGKEPEPIDAKDLDGKPVKLADLKGKVVLIDFWATWCGPCVAELPNVLAAYRKFHDRGFEILGVSLDRAQDEKKLRDFVKAQGMAWPQIFDGKFWEAEVAVLYKVHSIPATFLIDRQGKIHRVGLRGEALDKAIASLLKAPPAKG